MFDEEAEGFSNNIGNAELKLNYKKGRIEIKTGLKGESSRSRTLQEGGVLDFTGYEKDPESITFNMDYSLREKSKQTYSGFVETVFVPGKYDLLSIKYNQEIAIDDPMNHIMSYKSADDKFFYSGEWGTYRKATYKVNGLWKHNFGGTGRSLEVKADWLFADDDRSTDWNKDDIVFDDDDNIHTKIRYYRITPDYIDHNLNLKATYHHPGFADVQGLDVDFIIDSRLWNDRDNYSAANYRSSGWVDSLSFRESFNYLSLTVDPSVKAQYTSGAFVISAKLTPQYFTDRLNSGKKTEHFDLGQVAPLFDIDASWNPDGRNTVKAKVERTIKRPDYLQLCWFQRPDIYSNQIQEGNPNLQPQTSIKASLSYKRAMGRLTAAVEMSHTYMQKEIAKTYRNEGDWRIYYWINSGESNTTKIKATGDWKDKRLSAHAEITTNYYSAIKANGDHKDSWDYNIKADASYLFPKSFKLSAKARYESKEVRAYSNTSEYIGCDISISKMFRNKFEIILEGRDLFDHNFITEIESEDGLQARFESQTMNRRLFLLSLKYSF